MNQAEHELEEWGKIIEDFQLPRWNLLPDIDLYMDQVLTLIEKYLLPLTIHTDQKIITSAMINNYVKLGLIPAPVKKRYTKKHLAFLLAISILKQVFTIQEIKDGILFQASVVGTNEAFNLFCNEQEQALKVVAAQITQKKSIAILEEPIPKEFLAVKLATLTFATKLLTEKTIAVQKNYLAQTEAEEEK